MSIVITFKDVIELDTGMWRASIPEGEMKAVSKKSTRFTSHGIVILEDPKYSEDRNEIEVHFDGIDVISVGEHGSTILIDAASSPTMPILVEAGSPISKLPKTKNLGVGKFIESCRYHQLPEKLINSVSDLLEKLSSEISFSLLEGEQRKWTANPNFIALKIQNRNKKLLVSIKGNPKAMEYRTIQPKVSRPPYCEFHFESPFQMNEVFSAALRSARG